MYVEGYESASAEERVASFNSYVLLLAVAVMVVVVEEMTMKGGKKKGCWVTAGGRQLPSLRHFDRP